LCWCVPPSPRVLTGSVLTYICFSETRRCKWRRQLPCLPSQFIHMCTALSLHNTVSQLTCQILPTTHTLHSLTFPLINLSKACTLLHSVHPQYVHYGRNVMQQITQSNVEQSYRIKNQFPYVLGLTADHNKKLPPATLLSSTTFHFSSNRIIPHIILIITGSLQ